MMNVSWTDEQGLSLIEILVTLVLIVLVGAAAYSFFAYGSSYYNVADTITNLQHTAYGAMDDITMRLKKAKTVQIPSVIYSDISTDSMDITDQDGNTVNYLYNEGNLLRDNNNDGNPDTTLIDVNKGIYVDTIQFTDNDPAVTIRLRVRLADSTIVRKTGQGNIVLVEGTSGECGEDCIELYNEIVPRYRVYGITE